LAGAVHHIVFEDHHAYPSEVMKCLENSGYKIFRIQKTFFGPSLCSPLENHSNNWESPSYLATLKPDEANEAMAKKGWLVLSSLGSKPKL